MIDLHCHLLPGIDDGATTVRDSLEMARIAAADGITLTACTPHIYPGMYENTSASIRDAITALEAELTAAGIALALTIGADAHLTPELLSRLGAGTAPTLGSTRYFLLEPPHHVTPPRFEDHVASFLAAGYVPIITHPERLTWIDEHYDLFVRAVQRGAWLQVTSGSLTGDFGSDDAGLQQEHEGHVVFDLLLNAERRPDADKGEQRGQYDQQQADAVNAQTIVYAERRNPWDQFVIEEGAIWS